VPVLAATLDATLDEDEDEKEQLFNGVGVWSGCICLWNKSALFFLVLNLNFFTM